MSQQREIPIIDALFDHTASRGAGDLQAVQGELNRFVRWYGRDRPVSSLTPLVIEEYCATLQGTGDESNHRVAILKRFLGHLHRRGYTADNLSSHARLRRSGRIGVSSRRKGGLEACR